MIRVAIDNDILIKGSAYVLLAQLVLAVPTVAEEVGLLGASHFLVPKRLKKLKLNKDLDLALNNFRELEEKAVSLEPTEEETKMAGEFEFFAQKEKLSLDSGESQLLAIVVTRSLEKFVTGDKRAIIAMEMVCNHVIDINLVKGKAVCLEQLMFNLLKVLDEELLRNLICKEPHIDKTLAICFSCGAAGGAVNREAWKDGLMSYISDLRKQSPSLLSQ